MKISPGLKIGNKLEIEPFEYRDVDNKTVVSQLVDLKGNKMYISGPILEGNPYPLYEGQRIKIIYYDHHRGVFRFNAEVKRKIAKNELFIFEIKPVSEAEKIQRRVFYRLEATIKTIVKSLTDGKTAVCFTKDISGGGLKITSKIAFEEGEKIECSMSLQDDKPIVVVGEVVRVTNDQVTKEYEIGVNYIDIDEATRNKVIAFIFEKQRLLRKKGLM